MKMVAASRLRGTQLRMEASRGLPVPIVKLLGDSPGGAHSTPAPRGPPSLPLLPRRCWRISRPPPTRCAEYDGIKCTIVPVTSDKGLCGGINTTVVKYTKIVEKINHETDGALPQKVLRLVFFLPAPCTARACDHGAAQIAVPLALSSARTFVGCNLNRRSVLNCFLPRLLANRPDDLLLHPGRQGPRAAAARGQQQAVRLHPGLEQVEGRPVVRLCVAHRGEHPEGVVRQDADRVQPLPVGAPPPRAARLRRCSSVPTL